LKKAERIIKKKSIHFFRETDHAWNRFRNDENVVLNLCFLIPAVTGRICTCSNKFFLSSFKLENFAQPKNGLVLEVV